MTVRELRAEAKKRGIKLPAKARKAEIEELLGIGIDRSVTASVERDLAEIAKRDPRLALGSLAASALELGRQLDSPENSATSKSMCARSLTETLDRLHEQSPPEQEADRLDELNSRRAARRPQAAD